LLIFTMFLLKKNKSSVNLPLAGAVICPRPSPM